MNGFMARLLQLMPSALPGHCGDPKVSGAGKTPRRIPRQGRHGLGGEERLLMDALLRGSLPLGGVARRVSLEGNPSGMAAQVAVGKLMVGAKALLAAKILSGREVMPDWKNTAVRCVSAAHARRRPPCLRGVSVGCGRARALLCKRAPPLARGTVVPPKGSGRLVQYSEARV